MQGRGEAQSSRLMVHRLPGEGLAASLFWRRQEEELEGQGLVSFAQYSSSHSNILLAWVWCSAVPDSGKAFTVSLLLHMMLFRNHFNCPFPNLWATTDRYHFFFQCRRNGIDLETVKGDVIYYLWKLPLFICTENWNEFHKETTQRRLTKVQTLYGTRNL